MITTRRRGRIRGATLLTFAIAHIFPLSAVSRLASTVLVILAGALVAPALAAEDGTPANEMCPVLPEEPVDPNYWVEYEGRTVRFCCRKCRAQFLADPVSYVGNLPPADAVVAQGAADHDHTTDHRVPGERSRLLVIAGRLHVVAVHFPIALLVLAAFCELAGLRRRWRGAANAVRPLAGLGALTAVGAASLGLLHGLDADYRGDLLGFFEWHRALGLAAVAASVLAWLLVESRRRDPTAGRILAARVAVVALGILIGVVAHLGGALVFGPHYLVP